MTIRYYTNGALLAAGSAAALRAAFASVGYANHDHAQDSVRGK